MSNNFFEEAQLFGYYGSLLTERQQKLCSLYWDDNLSLSEIAENEKISRSAVQDALKKAEHQMAFYENQLHCLRDAQNRQALYHQLANQLPSSEGKGILKQLWTLESEGEKEND